ncbi:MAG: sigma-70 family RNA polymerase sigma factor, partial [Clostridia bacterium]|nr:sigma-70 family RNA polymerase sigma factor [Clostridia bacterium]
SPEDFVVSADNIRRMKSVIRSLPPVLREPLEMKIFEDLTSGEIAEELGITEEAVRQRLSRGRAQVRILWEEEEHGSHR